MRAITIAIFALVFGATMTDAASVAQIAARDVGIREGSRRANEMARFAGMRSSVGRSHPWCAAAVSYWLSKSGERVCTPSVARLKIQLRGRGWKRTGKPREGAVAFYRNWSHVAVVAGVKGNSVRVIEGNSANRVRDVVVPARLLEFYARI